MTIVPDHPSAPRPEVPAGPLESDKPPTPAPRPTVDHVDHDGLPGPTVDSVDGDGLQPNVAPRRRWARTTKIRPYKIKIGNANWVAGVPTPLDPPAPLVLDDDDDVEEMPTPWDALEASCSLLDEPTHRRAAASSGERTACPSPTRPTFTSQTRALMPDLRLVSAALLALPQGSPAPAAPKDKSYFNAANAASDALWPQEDLAPDAEKENFEPISRSSTPRALETSTVPTWRAFGRTAALSSFALAGPDSPGSSPPSSRATTPPPGPRAGLPAALDLVVHDAEVVSPQPLSATIAGPSFMAGAALAAPGALVENPVLAPVATDTHLFGMLAGAARRRRLSRSPR